MPPNPAEAHAKTMTAVTKASAVGETAVASGGAKLRDALVSVANHAVLRGPATGQIDVPELGRVMVRAHNVGGAADVDVTADRPDTRIALQGHVHSMTVDLRQADVPVARVTVDRAHGPFGQSAGSSSSSRDGDAQAHDSSRENPQLADDDVQPQPTDPSSPRRVRIVL
jgi:flagellar hook-length control protein FliK